MNIDLGVPYMRYVKDISKYIGMPLPTEIPTLGTGRLIGITNMSPLDMIFDELETGMWLVRTGDVRAFNPESREFDNGSSGYVWVKVAEPVRPEDDFALSSYKQFKVAAGKTLIQ